VTGLQNLTGVGHPIAQINAISGTHRVRAIRNPLCYGTALNGGARAPKKKRNGSVPSERGNPRLRFEWRKHCYPLAVSPTYFARGGMISMPTRAKFSTRSPMPGRRSFAKLDQINSGSAVCPAPL